MAIDCCPGCVKNIHGMCDARGCMCWCRRRVDRVTFAKIHEPWGACTGCKRLPDQCVCSRATVRTCTCHGSTDCTTLKPASKDEDVKHDAGKLRLDLVPVPALREVAEVFTFGALKYGEYNWAKGMAWSRLYAAVLRHLVAWHDGETFDPEPKPVKTRHLAHAICCLMMLLMYELFNLGKDDRPIFVQRGPSNTKPE